MQELKKTRRPRLEVKNNWVYVNGREASWGYRPNPKKNEYWIGVICDVYIFEMPDNFFNRRSKFNSINALQDVVFFGKTAKYLGHKTI